MKNKLSDVNNHLFAELERLGDEDLKGEDLNEEIKRANSVAVIAKTIITNADLSLRATKLKIEYADLNPAMPTMLTEGEDPKR
jgi:hypothetical protein